MLLIRYRNNTVLHGVLLAFGDQRIRVALQGSDDVAEYRFINHRWVSEDCELVEIGFSANGSPAVKGESLDCIMPNGLRRLAAQLVM